MTTMDELLKECVLSTEKADLNNLLTALVGLS
jgi:hypothetical protein